MEFSIKDKLRQLVETESGGKNTVMYDDFDNPMVMVWIPKFERHDLNWDSSGLHSAFVIDDNKTIDGFWVSKYPNACAGGVAIQRGMEEPARLIFQDAKDACVKKGKGWHLMTGLEWAAVALLSRRYATGAKTCHQYLGDLNPIHGMSHDGTPYGFMFNSTDWEHNDGVRIGPNFEQLWTWTSADGTQPRNKFWDENLTNTGISFDYGPDTDIGKIHITAMAANDKSNRNPNPNSGTDYAIEFDDIRILNENGKAGNNTVPKNRKPENRELFIIRDLALAPYLGTKNYNGRCGFTAIDDERTYTMGRGAGWQETQARGGSMFSWYLSMPSTRAVFFRAAYIPID